MQIAISDFGISKLQGTWSTATATTNASVGGTPQYQAPEQYVDDAVCCVYTCRRLIDLFLIAGTIQARRLRAVGGFKIQK